MADSKHSTSDELVVSDVRETAPLAPIRGDITGYAKSTLAELSNMLDAKHVVGEPIKIGDTTIVPLLNLGFGFGVVTGSGGGKGKDQTGTGFGGAIGGGGGVRPIGMLVIDKNGVRLIQTPPNISAIEQLAAGVSSALGKKPADEG